MINGHIHDDRENVLRLRTHMPKEALYKYVGENINQKHMRMLPTNMNIDENISERGDGVTKMIPLHMIGLE